MLEQKILVLQENKGQRLDKYLSTVFRGSSRTYIQELIKNKKVTVNSAFKSSSYHLRPGDRIAVSWEAKKPQAIPLVSLDVPIIYQDSDLVVVDKPSGLISHPAGGNKDSLIGCLLNMKIELSSVSASRPGLVHRLDKDTSGVMVVAKNNSAHLCLVEQFRKREIKKQYLAVTGGIFKAKQGQVDFPLKRVKYEPKMKVSFIGSKDSLTFYRVLAEDKTSSFLALWPKTGRMHQLRVHMAFLGHPIAGDKKYKGPPASRLMLHAGKLGFTHPTKKKFMEFKSCLPCEFKEYFPSAADFAFRFNH